MRYIIIGSSGGLGTYLYNELSVLSKPCIGIDISESTTVDIVLDSNFSKVSGILVDKLLPNEPISIITSVANGSRLRSYKSHSELLPEVSSTFNTSIKLLVEIASFLENYAENSFSTCHLINIGSVLSSKFTKAENPLYGASKSALVSLVRDLSLTLMNKNICVNSISPALLYRDESSQTKLQTVLDKTNLSVKPTSYSDILLTIRFICESGIDSLRGKDIVLDYGIESMEAFDLLRIKQ